MIRMETRTAEPGRVNYIRHFSPDFIPSWKW
jgi:hypothetical protein